MKKTTKITLTAALAIACALAQTPASAADGYKDLSQRIARSAARNAVKKIAVLDFTAKGGAEKSETAYVGEKMGVYLSANREVTLIERSLLEKVLKEASLSSAAGGAFDKGEMLRNILSLDAVVTGTVFADGDKLKVLAKLIMISTGRVLLAVEGETDRLHQDLSEELFQGMELPEIPFQEMPAAWSDPATSASRASFRDAVADSMDPSCSARRRALVRSNEELVDAKARYWAIRMKTPGFDRRSLTKNPGSEIGNPDIKAKFYRLLTAYYNAAENAPLDPEKSARVADLMKLETGVSDECGLF